MTGMLRNSLVVLAAGVLAVTLLYAAAADLEPDGNVTQGWNHATGSGTGFGEIDEGADTHDGDGTNIAEDSNNQIARYTWQDAPGDFGSTNSVTVKVAHVRYSRIDDNDSFNLRLYDSAAQVGGTKTATPSDGSYTVESFTDAAWDALTETQIDDLEIDVIYQKASSGMPDPGIRISISAITFELDYSAAAARSRVVDIQ